MRRRTRLGQRRAVGGPQPDDRTNSDPSAADSYPGSPDPDPGADSIARAGRDARRGDPDPGCCDSDSRAGHSDPGAADTHPIPHADPDAEPAGHPIGFGITLRVCRTVGVGYCSASIKCGTAALFWPTPGSCCRTSR